MNKPKRVLKIFICVAAFFSLNATAGTYNFRSLLAGERAVGMGGAYTALSDTAEGGYYNPAGLAFVDRTTLSAAGNFYSLIRGFRKDALTFAGATTDIQQNAFTSIPQIASYAQRIRLPYDPKDDDPLNTIALSVVVAEQVDVSGRINLDVPAGTAVGSRNVKDQTLYTGPSFSRRINDRLSFGVSAFYVLRVSESEGALIQDTADNYTQAFLERRSTIGNALAVLGVRYSPFEDAWIGLTYHTPSLELHNDGRRLFSAVVNDRVANTTNNSLVDESDINAHDKIPQKITFGIAYEKSQDWAVSADIVAHFGTNFSEYDGSPDPNIDQRNIVNFSVGGEYYLTRMIPIRAGVFSNFSAAHDIQPGVVGQADQVDHIGFSFTGGLERDNTSLNLGAVVTLGSGNGVDNLGNQIHIVSKSYSAVIAGSYKF